MSDSMPIGLPAAARPAATPALAIHAATLVTYLAASSALTPLYRLYQAQWYFSPMLLTLIFSVYAFALLAALVVAGALSDHIGRLPVIRLALLLQIGAMGLFLAAATPAWLLAARLLQGVATGIATAALGAALIDLDRELGALTNSIGTMTGLALGALGSSALVQLGWAPLHMVWIVLSAAFAVQLLLTWCAPETAKGRPGALQSLRPSIVVPASARVELLAVTPINVALWALGGFYLSLMPSLIAKVTGSTSAWLAGLSVAAFMLSGGAAVLIVRRRAPLRALVFGAAALTFGVAAILAGANLGMSAVLLIGSMIAGGGFGAGFLGAVSGVLPLAKPGERAGLTAAFYVENYLSNGLPAILAGYMAQRLDLLVVANLFGGAILLLVLTGLALTLLRHRRAQSIQEGSPR
jgi:hypothetical protein